MSASGGAAARCAKAARRSHQRSLKAAFDMELPLRSSHESSPLQIEQEHSRFSSCSSGFSNVSQHVSPMRHDSTSGVEFPRHNHRPQERRLGRGRQAGVKSQVPVAAATTTTTSRTTLLALAVRAAVLLLLATSVEISGERTTTTTQVAHHGQQQTPTASLGPQRSSAGDSRLEDALSSTGSFQDARGDLVRLKATSSSKDRNVIQSTAFNGQQRAPVSRGLEVERASGATLAESRLKRRLAPAEPGKSASAAQLLEYHLSQLSPTNSLAPITIQLRHKRQQQLQLTRRQPQLHKPQQVQVQVRTQQQQQQQHQQAATTTLAARQSSPNARWPLVAMGENNRTDAKLPRGGSKLAGDQVGATGGDSDLMVAAASILAPSTAATDAGAVAAQASLSGASLVPMRLPLQLHLKLKPLALPMPPPPSVRQQVSAEAERRRSLDVAMELLARNATVGLNSTTVKPGPAPIINSTSAVKPVSISKRFSFANELGALSWQEAKRVLLINSLAPPLVQAAHRVLQRRHSLLVPALGESLPLELSARSGVPPVSRSQRDASKRSSGGTATTSGGIATGARLSVGGSSLTSGATTTTTITPTTRGEGDVPGETLPPSPAKRKPQPPGATVSDAAGASLSPANSQRVHLQEQREVEQAKQLTDDTIATTTPPRTSTVPSGERDVSATRLGSTTAFSSAPLSQAHARGQHQSADQGQNSSNSNTDSQQVSPSKRLDSMYQIELSDSSIRTAASQRRSPALDQLVAGNSRPEDEARIQQMAAAMLPFVWPSFQLTANSGLGKLRARSLDTRANSSPTTSTTTTSAPTWSMKYQQLDRKSSQQQQQQSPAAASEFRPTFIDMDAELERERARRLRSAPGDSTSNELVKQVDAATVSSTTVATASGPPLAQAVAPTAPTSTTTTGTTTSTTARPTTSRAPQSTTSDRRKKRKKSGGYLQQQQQRLEHQRHQLQLKKARAKAAAAAALVASNASIPFAASAMTTTTTTPGPAATIDDSTRLASSYLMPKIKFNASSALNNQSSARLSELISGPAAARLAEQAAGATSSPALAVKPQLPKSLSQLIEQRLSRGTNQSSALNAAASTTNTTVRQNLLLLQEYFAQNAQNWSMPVGKLMLAPTTSVSKVVRLQPASLSPVMNRSALVQPGNQSLVANTRLVSEMEVGTRLADWVKPEQRATSLLANQSLHEATTLPATPPTTTTTTSTTTMAPSRIRKVSSPDERNHGGELDSPEIGSNKILLDDEELQSQTATSTAAPSTVTAKPQALKLATTSTTTTTTTTTMAPSQRPQQVQQTDRRQAVESLVQEKSTKNNRWQKHEQHDSRASRNNNIKLFHFKRKPDMNKLPFYKRPLNYTELGWPPEEIEREQRRLHELQQLAKQAGGSGDELPETIELNLEGQETSDSDAAEPVDGASRAESPSSTTAATPVGELLSLKRKRRARSQFERLMAELQAVAAAASVSANSEQQPSAGVTRGVDADQRVPAIRKKVETLVMKPMFFNVNQKRRQSNATTPELAATQTVMTTATTATTAAPTTTTPRPTGDGARNKPIVRMRRKEHGEHTLTTLPLEPEPSSTPWRPTRPNWAGPQTATSQMPFANGQYQQQPARQATAQSPSVRLMLVPSGLLTPSGSHPVPLFAATSSSQAWSSNKETDGTPAWQASTSGKLPSHNSMQAASATTIAQRLPEQAMLVAAGAAMAETRPTTKPQAMIAPVAANSGNGELRVPKLLARPMRPAKYSLNGYIPKPSLNQMQPVSSSSSSSSSSSTSQAAGPLQVVAGVQQTPPTMPTATGAASTTSGRQQKSARRGQQQLPAGPAGGQLQAQHYHHQHPLVVGSGNQLSKDLDSSTSNEIFSRRRGLEQASSGNKLSSNRQQLARSDGANNMEADTTAAGQLASAVVASGSSMLAVSGNNNNNNHKQLMHQQRLQMEENKRKYVRQHQQASAFRSPTLSVQKANQIKAKLGLPAPLNSIKPRHSSSGELTNNRSQRDSADAGVWWTHNPTPTGSGGNQSDEPLAASTHRISTLDPPANSVEEPAGDAQLQLFAGASPYNTIPKTDFECTNKKGQFMSGLFADVKTGCRVWHLCSNNRKYSFLCPTGTIFNSKVNSCDWKHSVRCGPE